MRVTSKVTPPDATDPPAATNGTERVTDTNLPERGTYHNYSRLPKLVLPTFSGEPLQWQMFWDSFEAAVDSNPHLTGIQKFNYLRAQLHGDAAHVIAGFPLSDSNYNHSITLLKERFGQQYKLVDAHMEALLNVLTPSHNLPSLQAFYDTIQNHMRALASLSKPPENYGSLLTSVILSKLPTDTKARIARDHYNTEWTIDDLLAGILKEIRILEVGQQSSWKPTNHTSPVSTTGSFYTATNRGAPQTRDRPKKDPTCAFCKGTHKPNLCTTVTCPKERLTIVKSAGLCYNCLA